MSIHFVHGEKICVKYAWKWAMGWFEFMGTNGAILMMNRTVPFEIPDHQL